MVRAFIIAAMSAVLTLSLMAFAQQPSQFGTAEQAKAMLVRAVVAVKADKAKALEMFAKVEGGFLDRDLYPFCFNISDGKIHPYANANGRARWARTKGTIRIPPSRRLVWNSTLRLRSRRVKSLRLPTCFQSRGPTQSRYRRWA